MRLCSVVCVAAVAALTVADPGSAIAAKPLPGCGPDVYVNTTVKGTPTDPLAYRFFSDGNESYPNGGKAAERIVGRFQVDNCTHDFTLNLNQSSRYMIGELHDSVGAPGTITSKFFNFDRVHSVPITQAENVGFVLFCGEGIVPGPDGRPRKNEDGSYQDNYGGCAQDTDGAWYVRRAATLTFYEGPNRGYYLYYQRSPLDGACGNHPQNCEATYVRVYHPDANTWILRPEEPISASLVNTSSGVWVGFEAVAFEIRVTK
jgi:hypothetical protein